MSEALSPAKLVEHRCKESLRYRKEREAFFTERSICEDCKAKPAIWVWSKPVTGGVRFLRLAPERREAVKHLVKAICRDCYLVRYAVQRDQHYLARHRAGCRCRKCKLSYKVHESTEALKPRLEREVKELSHGLQRPPETKRLPKGVVEETPCSD